MRRRGLSLLEILISFVLILLVTLYLMSMFASGQQHWKRAQQYSIATLLVHQKMQEQMALPATDLTTVSGQFGEPYLGYVYNVAVAPDELPLYKLDVEVITPIGAIAKSSTLVSADLHLHGVAVDPFSHHVAFVTGDTLRITAENDAGPRLDVNSLNPGRRAGSLGGFPGANLLWHATQTEGLAMFNDSGSAYKAVASAVAFGAPKRFTGVATDRHGNTAILGDSSNRCLWIYEDNGSGWKAPPPSRATDPPLGSPAGVACDPYASLIWVADSENQCLRKLMRNGPGGPDTESDPGGQGFWAKKEYRPSSAPFLGSPRGVAMDPNGWAVYVLDGGRLWEYVEEGDKWTATDLPPAVAAAVPSGLALDSHNSVLYVNCGGTQIQKYNLRSKTWSVFWP